MAGSVYKINKGIHRSIEFKGLKAQYIGFLAGGMFVLMIFFVLMYFLGINPYVCVILIFVFGSCLFLFAFKMSETYGEHGLMKKLAKRSVPKMIKCNSRKLFVRR
jgi:hypothetical protein